MVRETNEIYQKLSNYQFLLFLSIWTCRGTNSAFTANMAEVDDEMGIMSIYEFIIFELSLII